MNRAQISLTYATICQRIINECGDDYKKGSERIYDIVASPNLHPMLLRIIELAEYIMDDFRGEESEKHYWHPIKTTVSRFLAGEWEPTAWSAIIVYGFEEDGITKSGYGLNIRRHGANMLYESGNEQLVGAIKKLASSLDQNQTDEWFIRTLVHKLPKKVDKLRLQSSSLAEVSTVSWDELKY